jgi:transcriptional regulator with XRE-family HTH domain
LKDRRVAVNLRQEDVAKELEVDQSTVCKWELLGSKPLPKYQRKLAELYGCSVEDILESVAKTDQIA